MPGKHPVLILLVSCLVMSFLFAACHTPGTVRGDRAGELYIEKIREWQNRINKEGWSTGHVEEVLDQSLHFVTYRMELEDHWATPSEFIKEGLQGDCEDIAIFLMGTLKRLHYPRRVRVLAVRGVFSGHALVKVEMPDGLWNVYETTADRLSSVNPDRIDEIVEFDEKEIIHPSSNNRLAKITATSNP